MQNALIFNFERKPWIIITTIIIGINKENTNYGVYLFFQNTLQLHTLLNHCSLLNFWLSHIFHTKRDDRRRINLSLLELCNQCHRQGWSRHHYQILSLKRIHTQYMYWYTLWKIHYKPLVTFYATENINIKSIKIRQILQFVARVENLISLTC